MKKQAMVYNNKIFFYLSASIFMNLVFLVTHCFSQQTQEVSLTAYYPLPYAVYNNLRTKEMHDQDDAAYFLNPTGDTPNTGDSRMMSLNVDTAVTVNNLYGITSTTWTVRLDDLPPDGGNVHLFRLQADGQISMQGNAPIDGKRVYDIAEAVDVVDAQAADVVVISADEDLTFIKSKHKFDPKVAGVISEDPKLYLGQGQEKMPLALAGVVRCKVTTENGPIKAGDLLVTSSFPGHAMRADPNQIMPAMVVGTALESLADGNAKINILVN